jgi:hypothetical protein
MSDERVDQRDGETQDRPVSQPICRACGSRFQTESELREHQPYCSDPGFCLCHVDRIFYST